jgi:hypothetical protein
MSGESENWRERCYHEALEAEIAALRKRTARGCGAGELEGTLKHLYITEGADWGGRGEVQSIQLSAAIAAHELVIAELSRNSL